MIQGASEIVASIKYDVNNTGPPLCYIDGEEAEMDLGMGGKAAIVTGSCRGIGRGASWVMGACVNVDGGQSRSNV